MARFMAWSDRSHAGSVLGQLNIFGIDVMGRSASLSVEMIALARAGTPRPAVDQVPPLSPKPRAHMMSRQPAIYNMGDRAAHSRPMTILGRSRADDRLAASSQCHWLRLVFA